MAEALAKVKRDLGSNAVILHTRTVRRGGVWGIGAREVVEITASDQVKMLRRRPPRNTISKDVANTGSRAKDSAVSQPAATQNATDSAITDLRGDVGAVRSLVKELLKESRQVHSTSVPEDLQQTYMHLVEQEVASEITAGLLQRLRSELSPRQLADQETVHRHLASYIETMVPPAGPTLCDRSDRAKVVALVGPTGVGKTTTIAKLAANFKLREQRSVAMITIDTYRIAAVDQIRTYAQILDVPMKVVLSPAEFRQAIEDLRSHDIILVDTAGRSQNDSIKLNELRRFFDLAAPDEVHLVLASNCTQRALVAAAERFAVLGADRVIFTKLDESVGFGVILSVLKQVDAKLSYVTTGQDVPDDIEVGNGRRLARLILDGSASPPMLAPQGKY